jgi:phosphoglycerate dehydrogenase-like enzyme
MLSPSSKRRSLAAACKRGIAVCNVPDYGTEEVADHAIALALDHCRQLFYPDTEAKSLGWTIRVGERLRRLSTLTFGLVGLGRIGTGAALRAKALGFGVLFYDPYPANGVDKVVGAARLRTLEELLVRSEVLSLHCPLQPRPATPNPTATCHAAFCSVEAKAGMRRTSARLAFAAVRGAALENVVH